MRRLLFVVLSCITLSAGAQTAEQIVKRYSDSLGGLAAFNKIKTARITSTFLQVKTPMYTQVTEIVNGRSVRLVIRGYGLGTISYYYHNGKAWSRDSAKNKTEEYTGNDIHDMKAKTYLSDPLMDYKARGHTIELLGKETEEGIAYFKIKLTNKSTGLKTTYFINSTDYSCKKTVNEGNDPVFWMGTFKTNGLGFCKEKLRDLPGGGSFFIDRIDKIELDIPIDDKIFERN